MKRKRLALFLLVSCLRVVPAQVPTWRLVQEVRIDGVAENISSVNSLVALRDGGVAFVEGQDGRLRAYDARGQATWRFGKIGTGPGEFERVGNTVSLELGRIADTLWIYDWMLRRITLLSTEGQLLRTIGPPTSWSARDGITPSRVTTIAYSGANQVLAQARYSDAGRGAGRGDVTVVGATTNGDVTRRIVADADIMATEVSVTVGEFVSSTIPMLVARDQRAAARDGSRVAVATTTMTATGGFYRVRTFRSDGSNVFDREYPFVGIPISKSVADSVVAMSIGSLRATRPQVADAMERRLHEVMPRFMPPVSTIHIANDNAIWISGPSASGGTSLTVIDERGNQVGLLTLPPRTFYGAASQTTLWATQYDADDIPSLVRYRIQRN